MENPSWLFVIATVIAVVGNVIVFRQLVSHIQRKEKNQENWDAEQELIHFIKRIAVVEAIPMILVGLGILQVLNTEEMEIMLPLGLIILIMFFGIIRIFLLRQEVLTDPSTSDHTKKIISIYSTIFICFVDVIPLISIVIFFLPRTLLESLFRF
ncbi:hypothetical protein [Desmospora profundinema]|uniref:Aromatic ring-opening dioxygenase LigB subunit n=1 Tax=Desmospora profundinema TaxID=1571184 RepID=A0ABU1IPK5_9BACL|nr:hypothetical protein [Desmospora profundinema]MDR6226089.1 aromatic ring-opening dioxygenase LigB subunit [Desmospora profundinema]